MNLLGQLGSDFTRMFLFPRLQSRWHPMAFKSLQKLKHYEFAPPDVIYKAQEEKLKNLLRHAVQTVPYYRDVSCKLKLSANEIEGSETLSRLPILTKNILDTEGPRLISDRFDRGQLLENASGGSTGKPVHFYQDPEYWDEAWAAQWFVESWWGIRPGDRTASIWGTDRDLPPQGWKEKISSRISQLRVCNAFALTNDRMEAFARMLHSWQPRFIVGYATALTLFARFVLERPNLVIRPVAAKSTAEVLTDEERAIIHEAFKCPVFNFYGSREVNNLAAECPAHEGLHVNALNRYIEIVDEEGRKAIPFQPGRILVTDLTNYAMPFIRYESEDVGAWSDSPCTCGRPFPLLASILGRKSDFIVSSDGKLIHGEYFTHLFYGIPEVKQFQLVQETLTQVQMRVVLSSDASTSIIPSLQARLKDLFGPTFDCDVVTVPEIKRPPSGKHRFTISKVPVPWGQIGPVARS